MFNKWQDTGSFQGNMLRRGVCFDPGGIIGGIFGVKQPASPAPVAATPVPTVDTAAVAAQQQEQSDNASSQKKGALATLLNTGNTQTGDQLGSSSPETTLKRFLGS